MPPRRASGVPFQLVHAVARNIARLLRLSTRFSPIAIEALPLWRDRAMHFLQRPRNSYVSTEIVTAIAIDLRGVLI